MERSFHALIGRVVAVALGLTACLFGHSPAEAGPRVALVIGNGAYTGAAALANPVRDAEAIAASLAALGFEVHTAADVDHRATIAAIDAFSERINGAEIALLFFAGHGIQLGGQNFLLPTDVSVESERALRYSSLDIQEVVAEMERRADVSIVILDACRDNPFVDVLVRSVATRTASVERGLGPLSLTGRGALIAYAASSGAVAADGAGEHSPFANALLAEIAAPNVEVGLMFRRVARRVLDETGGQQRPELLVRLVDEVYLNPVDPLPVSPPVEPPQIVQLPAGSVQVVSRSAEIFFGDRPVRPPAWVESLELPAPIDWEPSPPAAIDEPAGQPSTFGAPLAIPIAATVATRISPRGNHDWFRFAVPAAGELHLSTGTVPAQLDLYARVWNEDHVVTADWQGTGTPGATLDVRFALPVAGSYWIEITDGNDNEESAELFTLAVDFQPIRDPFEPNRAAGEARGIPLPARFAAAIYPRGDADWYRVWVAEPGRLSLEATGVAPNLDVYARIWSANAQVVRDWVGPPRPGGDTLLEADLPAPGVYLIEVSDGNSDAASIDPIDFSVSFTGVPDPSEPNDSFGRALLVDATGERPAAIFPRNDADWLAIDVDHPGELSLLATNSPPNLDLYLRVWNADKVVVRDYFGPLRTGGDAEGFADLPRPGRYFIELVDGNNDASSPDLFDLRLAFLAQPDQYEPNDGFADATPLTPGGSILFNILPRADSDWFAIDAPSPGELSVVVDESPANLDLYWRLWNSSQVVVRDWVAPYRMGGAAEGVADLPAAGLYYLEVTDGNNDARSIEPATLTTRFTPALDAFEPNDTFGRASSLALGEPHTATILPRGDNDWFRLVADRAGEFVVTVEDVDPELDIWIRPWSLDAVAGQWFGPPRPGGVTEARFTVPGPGSYLLEVADGNNNARSVVPFTIHAELR